MLLLVLDPWGLGVLLGFMGGVACGGDFSCVVLNRFSFWGWVWLGRWVDWIDEMGWMDG